MGNQQCPESQAVFLTQQLGADEHEQQTQGNTGDDIRVCHGNVGQAHNRLAHLGLQTVDADGCEGAEHGGKTGSQHRNQHRVTQKFQQTAILEQAHILLQGETFKLGDILAGIERCYDQYRHGDIHKDEDQNGDQTGCLFHTTTPPSSSAPRRFMIPVQINTRIISSKLRAAPRFALLPCLN